MIQYAADDARKIAVNLITAAAVVLMIQPLKDKGDKEAAEQKKVLLIAALVICVTLFLSWRYSK